MIQRVTRHAGLAGGLLTFLLLLSPAAVHALTLADLGGGSSITTGDGALTFDNFVISFPDPVDGSPNAFVGTDISIFEIEVLDESFGFRVVEFDTPLVAQGSEIGNMRISFDVTADSLIQIDSVALNMTGGAFGTGAVLRIDETISGANSGDTLLQAIRVGGGIQDPIDAASLAVSESMLHIVKDITLDVRDPGAAFAQLSEFEQGFGISVIPEPTAATLFGSGVLVLGCALRGASPRRID